MIACHKKEYLVGPLPCNGGGLTKLTSSVSEFSPQGLSPQFKSDTLDFVYLSC